MKDTFARFLKVLPLALVFAVIVGTGMWILNHGDQIFSKEDEKKEQPVEPADEGETKKNQGEEEA